MNTSFIGHDGHRMEAGERPDFAKPFDWVMCGNDRILKRVDVPTSIYIKTDYIPHYLPIIMKLEKPFILVSACSDYSPSVYCPTEMQLILCHPFLLSWWMENRLTDHAKAHSFPVGFATHSPDYETGLLAARVRSPSFADKKCAIYCRWRNREGNVCGPTYIERPDASMFASAYPDICDGPGSCYDDISQESFWDTLASYKFCLCPLGNGIDPAPRALEALFLNTVPIMRRTSHAEELFCGTSFPVVFVDSWSEVPSAIRDFREPSTASFDAVLAGFTHAHWYKLVGVVAEPCIVEGTAIADTSKASISIDVGVEREADVNAVLVASIPLLSHVVYINLKHRTDRNEQVQREFTRMGFPESHVHRIDAVHIPGNGKLGAALSHAKALLFARNQDWPHVFVVEDDFLWKPCVTPATLVDVFQRNYSINTDAATSDGRVCTASWDVLMVSCNLHLSEPITNVDQTGCVPLRVLCGLTAAGYMVRRHYYDRLLLNFKESETKIRSGQNDNFECVDMHWQCLQRPDVWWALQLGIQSPGYSDIEEEYSNYVQDPGNKF